MKHEFKILFLSLASSCLFQGCAHTANVVDQKLDEKLAAENTVKSRSDLKIESSQLLENAPGLKDDERTKLKDLRQKTQTNLDALRSRSLKLRALLLQDMLGNGDKSDEIKVVKAKLKEVEEKRLSDFLAAIREANEIMGRWASRTQRLDTLYFDQMYYFDDPSF